MNRRTFTLVELLVVIAMISILISMLVPSIQDARESSEAAVCASNLKQQYTGSMIHVSNTQYLPNAADFGQHSGSWMYTISEIMNLPATKNATSLDGYSDLFNCPSNDGVRNYGYNQWAGLKIRLIQNFIRNNHFFEAVRMSKVSTPSAAWFISDHSYHLYNEGYFGINSKTYHANKVQGVLLDGSVKLLNYPNQTKLHPDNTWYWSRWAWEDGDGGF
ncbi:MAG: type II secretion system GspH family protein [Lentisphaeraceae bacterium]|nr:type II secretion system GspH family protein [Lentisphaeraceae bacterium]